MPDTIDSIKDEFLFALMLVLILAYRHRCGKNALLQLRQFPKQFSSMIKCWVQVGVVFFFLVYLFYSLLYFLLVFVSIGTYPRCGIISIFFGLCYSNFQSNYPGMDFIYVCTPRQKWAVIMKGARWYHFVNYYTLSCGCWPNVWPDWHETWEMFGIWWDEGDDGKNG